MSEKKTLPQMPTVPFGEHRVSRLIVGGNPFVWNSHFTEPMNKDMESYFTPERIVDTLVNCRRAGIDTFQGRGDYHRILHCLELLHRREENIQFIAQTASEMHDIHHNIKMISAFGAQGIYFHGTETDRYWREGRIDDVREYLKTMRDTGVQVGMAAHIPEIFDHVESADWDLDFYMTPFYNVARKPRESAVVSGKFEEEEFHPDDPERICRFIQQTERMCLAYKILGCGRTAKTQEEAASSFKWAFARIKPNDAVVVGMFPKYEDQPRLDVRYTVDAIAAAEQEWVKLT